MRVLALMSLPVLAALAIAPAPTRAQTYNRNYPVCIQVFGLANYIDCRFTSLPQCNATAAGGAAQCIPNPYFANAYEDPAMRHHRRAYRDY